MTAMLLAFDIGTTGNKAALVDGQTGGVVGSATASYPTRYTEDGGAEQSPDDWWRSVGDACRELRERQPEAWKRIAAVACGGMMNGVVLTDARGNALRDAILHADVRSAPQCRHLEAALGREAIWTATANRPDCHLTLPKVMWLRENEPDVLDAAAFVVQAKDYVAGRLTGVAGVTDPSDASLTGAFDVKNRVWATDVWEAAGLPTRLLPTVIPSTQIIGKVTADAARHTGLTAGTPVVTGGGDGACATAGSGVAPNEAYLYLGGTAWIGLNAAAPLPDSRLSAYCNLDDERLTVIGTAQSAGSSLEWCARTFGQAAPGDLDALAATVPPGARNLFFLPYLQGERAPLWDSEARGIFFGLATHHGPPELFRAVLEGVGFALSSILDVFDASGHALPELRLLGGGANSALWRAILGAIFDRRLLTVADVSAATSRGAAMAAGVGVGVFSSWRDARACVQIVRDDAPNPALAAAYPPRAAFFRTLYPALAERFAALTRL